MEKRLNDKNKMIDAIIKVWDANAELWKGHAALVEVYGKIKANRVAASAEDSKAAMSTSGSTVDKGTVRVWLEGQTFHLSSALCAMGHAQKNATLWKAAEFSLSDLEDAREQDLKRIAEDTVKLAAENMDKLGPYSITTADTDTLTSYIESFDATLSGARAMVSERGVSNAKVFDTVADSMNLLKTEGDRLMVAYRLTQPDFYAAYQNARKIVSYGVRHEKKPGDGTK